MVKTKRRTDGHDPLPSLQILGFAQFQYGQILTVDLQQRHVGTWIGTDQLGFQLTAISQADEDLVSIGNHVVVGQNVAIGRDDEARAQGLSFTLATATTRCPLLRHATFKELAQHRRQAFQVRHLLVGDFALRQFLRGTDVDHGWRGLLDQLGEIRQLDRLRGHGLSQHQHRGDYG